VTQNLVISNKVPDAPTINSVSGGDASATISFTPGRNGGAAITTETITATNTSSNATTTYTITSGTSLVTGSATFPGSDTATSNPFGQVRYKMTGLTNGQTYTFTVTATNSVGTSAASTASLAITPVTAPNAVSGLVATAGSGQVVLSWVSPGAGGLGGGTFVSYTIYKKLHSAGSYSGTADITDTASVNDTSATITGLTNGTAYDFKVLINATGGSAQASDYTAYANLIPAAAPNAPTLTISYASSTSVTVTWVGGNSNGSATTGYTLTYTLNGSSTSCSGGNTTTAAGSSCTITGAAGDDFGATAYATNLIGNSPTASASFTLIGTAAAPASLVGTAGDGSATIAFTEDNNGDPISDYLYSLDGGVSFISSGSKSSPITITGLTNGTPVSIIIQAVGAVNGVSASSTSVTVTPAAPAAPAAPAPGGGGSKISVTTTIDRTTTSSQSPIVQKGIDAISNHKDVDQYFKSPTTISNQPTGTTITTSNIQSINSSTAVNTQVVTTTSNKQAVVTISLTAPIITDQAVAALATKITVVSSQTGLTVTPVAGFTGVLVVPVIATVNGVQITVLNKVVVNPVAPAAQGFAPTDIGKSSVAWTASASQVTSYQVAINGKAAGTTTASNISLPSLIGPKSKVTVTAMGNDQTASTPIVIPYVAKAPIPALKVNFISGSAVLTPAQKADISSIAKVIDTQGFTRLVVNGFTDAVGSPAANAVLSQARAQAVVAYMKTILPKVAVKAGANGSANPVADNTTPTGQAQNRRTEIATW
jgi:titin